MKGSCRRASCLRVVAVAAAASFVCVWHPGIALAQDPGRIRVSAGVRWTGETPVGSMDATETGGNAPVRYRLFATDTSLVRSIGVDTAVGLQLSRAIDAELSASYGAPELRTRIRADAEGIPDAEAVEAVGQLAIEASLLVHVTAWSLFGRATPFVSVGGGYLRHLHEGRTLAETGAIYHAGGGVTIILRSGGRGLLKGTGLRADARAVVRKGGVAFDDDPRVAPAIGLSLVARF